MVSAEIKLRPYQQAAREAVETEWDAGRLKTLLVLPTGCHEEGQLLLMADGTTRAVEDIKVGDKLLGMDGKPRKVLFTQTGYDTLYQVTPVKGKPFRVTGDHMLSLIQTNTSSKPKYPSDTKGGTVIDVTVKDYLEWPKSRKHIYKLFRCSGVEKFSRKQVDTPIDPYFLGILLGDGGLTTGISITTMEPETEVLIREIAERYGAEVRTEPAGKAKTYFLVGAVELRKALIKLKLYKKGSGSKFVPYEYQTAPIKERLEMIAGLIDTDGSLTTGGYDFISKSKALSEDLIFMCRSVGLAAYSTVSHKGCGGFTGTYYRVSISGDCGKIPCRVLRKKAPERKQKKDVLRTGFTVSKCNLGKYYGITIDGDNRYVMDDFTVTHNCGKTIVFAKITEDRVAAGDRVLILAHRGELLDQAADKLMKSTRLRCAVEKAEQNCLENENMWYRVVVGSVQTLTRDTRLNRFPTDYFKTIIVDEAHHSISDSYQKVLQYFSGARVLGVTATPDRGDMRNLGSYFDSLAYEYTLPKAIKEGYLCPIKALTVPIKLDMSGVSIQSGDYKPSDIDTALDPYLAAISDEMATVCRDRKTVVFLPLIKTSQKFRDLLNERGFKAAEVNGGSDDRAEILSAFDRGEYDVLCNSMLLTEGWDCPTVDCIVVLRPTKIRSLYAQMVGRGTRLSPGKDHLLLLDFLWHTERHELCRPAYLIAETPEVRDKMTENLESADGAIDLAEAEEQAQSDAVAEREAALAEALKAQRKRKRALVDPLQFEMSIQAEDLAGYTPAFGWECAPASPKQLERLEKLGIFPDEIDNAGKANLLLDRLGKRREEGLTTPKQIRFLESRGFIHVGSWRFETAKKLIDRIASNDWRVPYDINPATYTEAT